MLDTNTKRRIDTARDILVGKVPDPKSQVERITIALIYKFMDDLDAEGITRMTKNPGLPELFREIFKNAFLPYRDPETLKAFLKIIDEFSYDHSEKLGDAFEYLLSVLGSQGDAGRFRTPRSSMPTAS
jgi:type I restriction enzyme M protein